MQMKRIILSFVLVAIFSIGTLSALDQVRIKNILDDPYRYRQDTVLVLGAVTQYGEETTKYSRYYYLRDDYGGIIKIITDLDWPEVNVRYEVRGIVIINDKGEVHIVERDRKDLSYVPPRDTDKPTTDDNRWMYYLIGLAGLLLIAVIVLAIVITNRRKPDFVSPISASSGISQELFSIPEPVAMVEGSTIKMAAAPAGTLKLLPGRFEVAGGDDTIKEIRFYKTKSQDESEITFGRCSGPNYTHIQLKPMTVSSKQAKLLFTNGKYTLINYSTVNPTVVNGMPLNKESSVSLEEGTKIEMGEVVFIFHEK